MAQILGPGGLSHKAGHAWETFRYACDNTGRTVRLCVMLLVSGVASVSPFLILALLRGYLG
jgi:hypothetical protein